MRVFHVMVLFLAMALALPGTALAASRVALVIGNGAYAAAGQLANPLNDARIVAQSLNASGFETVSVSNASFAQFRSALSDFRIKAQGAEIALVYFAGHGIEANRRNWLLPVDAKLASDFDLSFEAIDLDQVLSALTGAKVRIVVLDACRNNPFGQSWKSGNRAVTRGLGRVEVDDVMVLFAAEPGSTASDGTGGNSPFAASLAKRLVQPGLQVQLLGNAVRDDVVRATGGTQRPYVSASMGADPIYFVSNAPAVPAPTPPPIPAPLVSPTLIVPAVQPQVGTGPNAAALILECDRLAGDEFDPDRPVESPFVDVAELKPTLAISACTRALDASPGNARMMAQLGNAQEMLGNDKKDQTAWAAALRYYEQAAALGSANAMHSLASMYGEGRGVPQDYSQACRWYQQAADKGYAPSMNELGNLYQRGQGVAQDFSRALRWYEQAAGKGNTAAMTNLGRIYERGLGVPKNDVQSRHWYNQASALRERSWYQRAAEKGDQQAKQWLAQHPGP